MKNLSRGIVVLVIMLVFAFGAFAAQGPLTFKDLKGPQDIMFGPIYTYSVLVEGEYDRIGWSPTGGKLVRDWWEGSRYFCEVQWYENKADDPAEIEVWGEDKATDEVTEVGLRVTVQAAKKRSLGYQNIQSAGGKCLAVPIEDIFRDGGFVYIWECTDVIQQHWKFDSLGRLVNEGGKCLDVHAPDLKTNGGKVQLWECGEVENQKWQLDEKGRLINGGGKCLDIHAPDMGKDGGKVQIWDCGEVDNQKWNIADSAKLAESPKK